MLNSSKKVTSSYYYMIRTNLLETGSFRKVQQRGTSGSLITVARELARNKLDLVGVHKVRWDKWGTVRAEDYIFFYVLGKQNHQLGKGLFVHHKTVSAVKKS
jgi:hypothetical protein